MRLLSACLILGAIARGDAWCVTAVPQTPEASALLLGTARTFFTWELAITSPDGHASVSRADLVERLKISVLRESQARDVLKRRAASDRRTILAQYLGAAKDLGPMGLTYAGTRIQNPLAKGGLIVAGVVWALVETRAAAKPPDPSATEALLFPDAGIAVGPQGWSGVVITGKIHEAKKIERDCGANGTGTVTRFPLFDAPVRFDLTRSEYPAEPL